MRLVQNELNLTNNSEASEAEIQIPGSIAALANDGISGAYRDRKNNNTILQNELLKNDPVFL